MHTTTTGLQCALSFTVPLKMLMAVLAILPRASVWEVMAWYSLATLAGMRRTLSVWSLGRRQRKLGLSEYHVC